MSNISYEIDPRLKTFYDGLSTLNDHFSSLMISILSAEYRDKILNEGMDPHYALQEAIQVGNFRSQHASVPKNLVPLSVDPFAATSQPIKAVEKLRIDELEAKADKFIDETNKQCAREIVAEIAEMDSAGIKYQNYPLRDNADRIAFAVADAIEDEVGSRILHNRDSSDNRDMLQYLATLVREGYNLPNPSTPTQQTYEQAAATIPITAEDTHGAAREILGELKGLKGIRQAFDDVDLVTQVQIIQRMDDIIRRWVLDDPLQPKDGTRLYPFEEAKFEPEEPQLTSEQDRISELWWAKVDQLKDDIDRGDRLINAHAAMLLNRVLEGKKSFDAAWVDFQSFAEERQGAKRYSEQVGYFNVAHEWANKEGITPLEAAHGVAKTLYIEHHQVIGSNENISREYNEVYDYNYAEEIRARRIRAAKELFGS